MANLRILNRTDELVRVALFRESGSDGRQPILVWRLAAPPPGGASTIEISKRFEVRARYSIDDAYPERMDTETAPALFDQPSAAFTLSAITDAQGHALGATLRPDAENVVAGQLRVLSEFGRGVEIVIAQSGDNLFQPSVVWPGSLLIEKIPWSLYLAVAQPFTRKGDRVPSMTRDNWTPVDAGKQVTITGSKWFGYRLSVAPDPSAAEDECGATLEATP